MASIVVAGGGMCGLTASMITADDGHEVRSFDDKVSFDPRPGPDRGQLSEMVS